MPKNRPSEYRIAQRQRVIDRKKHIIRSQNNYWYVPYDGMLSKGKIHCSCWMCRRKSYDDAKPQDVRNAQKVIREMVEETDGFGVAGVRGAHRVYRRTVTGRGLSLHYKPEPTCIS